MIMNLKRLTVIVEIRCLINKAANLIDLFQMFVRLGAVVITLKSKR